MTPADFDRAKAAFWEAYHACGFGAHQDAVDVGLRAAFREAGVQVQTAPQREEEVLEAYIAFLGRVDPSQGIPAAVAQLADIKTELETRLAELSAAGNGSTTTGERIR